MSRFEKEHEHEREREHEREHEHERERERERPPVVPASIDGDGLPPHRIAFRAAVRGATAGLCVGVTAILGFAIGDTGGAILTDPAAWLLMWVGAATGCGLLVGADEVSQHAPPRLRLPTAAVVGVLTTAIMSAAVVWLGALLARKGADGAWSALAGFFDEVLRRPDQFLPGAAALLLVFLALWLSRTIRPGLAGLLLRSLVGAAAGLASFGLLCACWGFPHREAGFAILLFTMVPAAAVPGLWLGGVVEERLLRLLARWRAAAEDG